MAAQESAHTLGEGSAKSHPLLKFGGSFREQVSTDVRMTQSHARVASWLFLRGTSQREHFAGDFHLAAVGVVRDIYQLPPIQFPAVVIHPGISPGGIFTQNTIEPDQRLDDDLPCSLSDFAETKDRTV